MTTAKGWSAGTDAQVSLTVVGTAAAATRPLTGGAGAFAAGRTDAFTIQTPDLGEAVKEIELAIDGRDKWQVAAVLLTHHASGQVRLTLRRKLTRDHTRAHHKIAASSSA